MTGATLIPFPPPTRRPIRKRRKGEKSDFDNRVDVIVDSENNVSTPLWFPDFERGDVVVVDTAQTKLGDGLFAAFSEKTPMGHLAGRGRGVVFFEIKRQDGGWIGVRRLARDHWPWHMYPDGRKKIIPDLIGRIVAKFHLFPGFEQTPVGRRYLGGNDAGGSES